jgi:hypothetical protein
MLEICLAVDIILIFDFIDFGLVVVAHLGAGRGNSTGLWGGTLDCGEDVWDLQK